MKFFHPNSKDTSKNDNNNLITNFFYFYF